MFFCVHGLFAQQSVTPFNEPPSGGKFAPGFLLERFYNGDKSNEPEAGGEYKYGSDQQQRPKIGLLPVDG